MTTCSPKFSNKIESLTGDKISDNFIKAIGGEKKLKEVKTMVMIAVVQTQGIEFELESYRKAPDKMVLTMKSNQGTMTRILNGEKAVVITSNGNEPITGNDLKALQEEATIFPELYRKKFGHKLEYLGIEKVNERDMYKVKLFLPNGNSRLKFYDKETDLLKKVIDEEGRELFYNEYNEVKGVRTPHLNKMISPTGILKFKITEVKINPVLENEMFEIK